MTAGVRKTRVPGLGVRYSFTSADGDRVAVVLRDGGVSELYVFAGPAHEEPQVVVRLQEGEAKLLGMILDGARERPMIVEDLDVLLGDLAIAWTPVAGDSPALGCTLADCDFEARTGIAIIAILREPDPVAGAQPGDIVQEGDTLVTIGRLGQYPAFRKLLAEGPFPTPAPASPAEE